MKIHTSRGMSGTELTVLMVRMSTSPLPTGSAFVSQNDEFRPSTFEFGRTSHRKCCGSGFNTESI